MRLSALTIPDLMMPTAWVGPGPVRSTAFGTNLRSGVGLPRYRESRKSALNVHTEALGISIAARVHSSSAKSGEVADHIRPGPQPHDHGSIQCDYLALD